MMRTAVFTALTIAFAVALLAKGPSLIRDPRSPFLRALCAVVVLAGTASVAGIPPVSTSLETTTGVLAVWVIAPIAAGTAALRATHLVMLYPPDEARRKINARLVYYALAVTAIIVLCVMARGQVSAAEVRSHQDVPEALWRSIPYVREAYLVYCAIIGYTFLDSAVRLAQTARVVDRRRLQRALWVVCAGNTLMLIYALALAGFFISYRFGYDLPWLQTGGLLVSGLGGVASGIGVAMPVLGPRWDRLVAYRQLRQLWLSLGQVQPNVVLERPWWAIFDAWNPLRSDFRLYRRVIEIRDGALALRPYLDPQIATAAQRLAQAAGQQPPQLDATVAAAQLKAAIEDKRQGRPPHQAQPAHQLTDRAGRDLDSELRILVPIAQAFATSDIVRTAVAQRHAAERTPSGLNS